ncbi:emp24/gp25L/p24 family/GOLD-domain-containing protein, partial [Sporodiniella umbellata]
IMAYPKKAFILAIFTFVLCLKSIAAITVEVHPETKECFYELLERHDSMSITYQVDDDSEDPVQFWLTNPQDNIMISQDEDDQGSYTITAPESGKYRFCFSNEKNSESSNSISFNTRVHQNTNEVEIDPLQREIEELTLSIFGIKSSQEYIVARERRHRDTVESTNARVKWWSITQLGLLVSVCFFQIYYLKSFFQTKRAV